MKKIKSPGELKTLQEEIKNRTLREIQKARDEDERR